MVLVDDHELGEMPAVLRYLQQGPFAGGAPLLLIRDRDLSPHLIQAAAQVTLSLMERGHDRPDTDLMVPIPSAADGGRPAAWWAEDAFGRLQSASAV